MVVKGKRFLICLAVLLIWIAFIFTRSLQSTDHSNLESQWVLDLLQKFCPFSLSMYVVRKLAHFIEFAVLGMLAGLLFGGQCKSLSSGLLLAALTGVIIALGDETIQLFVPGRTSRVSDVWLDIAGASAGTILVLVGKTVIQRRTDGGDKR